MYSLMGAGLHGRRGLNPLTSYKIWECFGQPRATYGLETVKLTKADVDNLERYQRGLLRQLQSLPDRCANIPVYTLLGAKPMRIVLDIRALSFFGNMVRQEDTLEYQIIRRQLSVKDENSSSFTVTIRKILQTYNLPDAYELINNMPNKERWKTMVKEATNTTYRKEIMEDIKNKSSLKFLEIQQHPLDDPHLIYRYVGSNPHEVEKAAIKARLLTGTYTLQANRHRFNQYEVDKTCELCSKEAEDRQHFILHCTALEQARNKHMPKLLETVPNLKGKNELLLQCILDCSHKDLEQYLQRTKATEQKLEEISRSLLYDLHTCRTRTLSQMKTRTSSQPMDKGK